MHEAQILVVDDEEAILKLLQTVFRKEGFLHVDTASTGEEAIEACQSKTYDIVVLDVMLPGQSGFEICPFIRKTTNAPILFLTARSTDFDKLTGFAVGGDDYITKPFNPLEVVARIKAQLRRYKQAALSLQTEPKIYDFGRFQVDEYAGELYVEGQLIDCPPRVFQLLLFLCQNPNRLFSKRQLYEQAWGEESFSDDNTVMVHIHRIRERIEKDPGDPKHLITVRGLGYKLVRREQT